MKHFLILLLPFIMLFALEKELIMVDNIHIVYSVIGLQLH